MFSLQTTEAETSSLRQQSRIEELEAQLHEAEDIIADLRIELKEAKGALQNMRNKEVQSLNGQILKVDAHSPENGTTEPMPTSPPDSRFQILSVSDINDKHTDQRVLDNTGCDKTRHTDSTNDYHLDNYCADNPDLAPIIMRSKEPELYRNGRTQRIRALGRNLQNVKLPHEDMADQCSLIKNESVAGPDGKDEGLLNASSFKIKNMDRMKNLTELEDGKELSSNNEDHPVKVMWRLRRRRTRFGSVRTTSRKACPRQLKRSSQPTPVRSYCKTYSNSVKDRVESGEEACTVPSPKGNGMDNVKNYTELGQKNQHSSICFKDQAIKSTYRRHAKRDVKYRATFMPLSRPPLDRFTESSPLCFLSHCSTTLHAVNSNVKSEEEQLKTNENEPTLKPPTRLNPGLTLIKTDVDLISGSANVTLHIKDVNRSGALQIPANDDTELANKHMSVKQEDDAAGSSRFPDLEMIDAQSGNSDSNDANTFEATNGTTDQGDNNRLLKYTFQRKRKKEFLYNPSESSSPEKSTIKRRANRKTNGEPEGEKSNLINQSSRDSRRLAQVARQVGYHFPFSRLFNVSGNLLYICACIFVQVHEALVLCQMHRPESPVVVFLNWG